MGARFRGMHQDEVSVAMHSRRDHAHGLPPVTEAKKRRDREHAARMRQARGRLSASNVPRAHFRKRLANGHASRARRVRIVPVLQRLRCRARRAHSQLRRTSLMRTNVSEPVQASTRQQEVSRQRHALRAPIFRRKMLQSVSPAGRAHFKTNQANGHANRANKARTAPLVQPPLCHANKAPTPIRPISRGLTTALTPSQASLQPRVAPSQHRAQLAPLPLVGAVREPARGWW